jgi:cytoplasmic iron level regulating protein YaaA (DUF328/UPF0246 family)
VLILLPPSEAKLGPTRGRPLALADLSFPELTSTRTRLLSALVALSADPAAATRWLGLSPGQSAEITRNSRLATAPTAPAGRIYSGVLYDALGLDSLSTPARRRAGRQLLVTSSLFGLLHLADRIPAYRLSGDASLPAIGTVASTWRGPLSAVLGSATGKQLVVDLRSGTYAGFWRPTKTQAARVVSIRVLHEVEGTRKVVSHFNKATKGRIVRALLESDEQPRTPGAFADHLGALGWKVEPTAGNSGSYDVVVEDV